MPATAGSFLTIVVGLGAMGSAALYHLAKAGHKVLGLESEPTTPHSQGSSHGLSRIIRVAYHEGPQYYPLLKRAYELWEQLEQEAGEVLFLKTGYLDIGAAKVSDGQYDLVKRSLQTARQYNIPHRLLTANQVNKRFPGYRLPPGFQGLYQADGGVLIPESCIAAHVSIAQRWGAQVQCGEPVHSWAVDESSGKVQVTTSRGSYLCDKLVVTAGARIAELVPQLQAVCVPQRQVVGWFEVSKPENFTPQAFPVFVVQQGDDAYYGFPQLDGAPGFKIGKFYHLKQECTSDTVDRQVHPEDEQLLRGAVSEFFPDADGPLLNASVCMFTNVQGGDFIIDTHPAHPQVILCSACSGHGFKMSNTVGQILSQLAEKGDTEFDISSFRITQGRQGMTGLLDKLKDS